MDTTKPTVFVSSVHLNLETLGRRLVNWTNANGLHLWIAEIEKPELRPPENASDEQRLKYVLTTLEVCLEAVRNSTEVIFIGSGYGSLRFPFEATGITIIEMELFQAALHFKPIHVFALPDASTDDRLQGLLELISAIHPELYRIDQCDDNDDAFDKIIVRLKEIAKQGQVERSAPHLQLADKLRKSLSQVDLRRSATEAHSEFLDKRLIGIRGMTLDSDLLTTLIATAESCQNQATRLSYLWVALRHLASVPYDQPEFANWLPFWERVLKAWASTAAWYGLHGFLRLGRLAAVNSLRRIEALRAANVPAPPASIHSSLGGLASEYYSMAKLAPSKDQRRALMQKALELVTRQITIGTEKDASGLLLIRAPIELALGKRLAAIRSCRRALAIRREANDNPGRVGEAETHLGFAYLNVLQIRSARNYLSAGVAKLQTVRSDGFLITAQKKLGYCYLFCLDLKQARMQFEEAFRLSLEQCCFDQAIQIDSVVQSLPLDNRRRDCLRWISKGLIRAVCTRRNSV